MKEVQWSWLGRVPYAPTLERQEARRTGVIEGTADEVLWLLEHDPVITTGRRPVPDLPSHEAMEQNGIDLVHTNRGGLATFHGPGQLIAYPIIDAWSRGLGVKGTIGVMEGAVIQWLADYDICAKRRCGFPGVWVNNEKICAIGMHFRRGVSMHGIAVNLDPDWTGFNMITPCGIQDAGLTSIARLCGTSPSPSEAAHSLAHHINDNLMRHCNTRSDETG